MPKKIFAEDEDIIVPQPIIEISNKVKPLIPQEDSDDEAPEAVSTTTSKTAAMSESKARKNAAASIAAADKEKRRQRDLLLKQQKQGSRRAAKKEEKKEEEGDDDPSKAEIESIGIESAQNSSSEKQLLPAELLAQVAKEDALAKKRKHLTAQDFELIEAEEEAEREANRKKRNSGERYVGEYTVKVLNSRQQPPPADKRLASFKDRIMNRRAVQRVDALRGATARKGDVSFRRRH